MTENHPEFLIVGGGVYGCATAWHLASKGASVLLLEARSIAFGASGGEGKRGVRANGRDLRELPLMSAAYAAWPRLDDMLGADTGYERCGQLRLIERKRDWDDAVFRSQMQNAAGIETQLLERGELDQLQPGLAPSVIGAMYCPKDGVSAQHATTMAYAAAARAAGAELREQSEVKNLRLSAGGTKAAILADGTEIPFSKGLLVLNNAGAADLLNTAFNANLPVWRRFPQAILTTPPGGFQLNRLTGHASRKLSMKMTDEGKLMISGGWVGDWNGRESIPDPAQVRGNMNEAAAVFPALSGCEPESVDVSRAESQTLDNIPVIDQIGDNTWFATGWCGHGWAIAPVVARDLAEWVLTGVRPTLLEPFTFKRFPGGRP